MCSLMRVKSAMHHPLDSLINTIKFTISLLQVNVLPITKN